MNSILLLATLVAIQGQALELTEPHVDGLVALEVTWDGLQIPFVRNENSWHSVVGVDLDMEAGQYPLELSFRYNNDSNRLRSDMVDVRSKSFPTTELTVAPKYVQLSDENQERAAVETREINSIYATLTPLAYWSRAFEVPIPGTVGGRNFGHRRVFNGEPRAPHSGADLTAATGVEILAANAGKVVLAKDLFFSGKAIFLDHGLGIYTTYLHLSEMRVEPGTMVERGQVIGLAGATGRVTGPHLHWGVRILGARVDPFSLLEVGAGQR
jgi:murein DD-endopeptidase MepM/ murein hydrolase activator NlpD